MRSLAKSFYISVASAVHAVAEAQLLCDNRVQSRGGSAAYRRKRMKTWKSKLLVAALALSASPVLATAQGTTSGQSSPPSASAQSQGQAQPSEQNRNRRRHRRRRHRPRRHHRRNSAMRMRYQSAPNVQG